MKTKKELEAEKKLLEKKIEKINQKIIELDKPAVIGFVYKNRKI